MNEMINVQSAAQKWGISPRRVQILCNEGRIDGAVKKSGVWFIPTATPKPAKQNKLPRNQKRKSTINVLSLFSGCGGMDLGFEGDFEVLKSCVNLKVNTNWNVTSLDENWVHLPKNRFHTDFANDITNTSETIPSWLHF